MPVDVRRPQAVFREEEPAAPDGPVVEVLTVLLTGRECPWRCLMCDLWRHTSPDPLPPGAVTAQLRDALSRPFPGRPRPAVLKLYNSGSFFDPGSVPPADRPEIARLAAGFDRLVVECHPKLALRPAVEGFLDELARGPQPAPRLEVALGLETVHPDVLDRLNKRMTAADFARATRRLNQLGVAVRAFVLLQPPFLPARESVAWAVRSAAFAFEAGARAVSIIPTRPGNGALDALAAAGVFSPPTLDQLEAALERALALRAGLVFADVWDLERFSACPVCFPARRRRLEQMNRTQRPQPAIRCPACAPA
ncbi:MAG: radical SAM protein [Verrucomicrobia bacterium]|nr:MAG: radical SAM protein [Verrucomicrobiota bacterium]